MKSITFYQENGNEICLVDDNDEQLDKFSAQLSSILEETNIVILETSKRCLIIRPTRINAIEVQQMPIIEEDKIIEEEEEEDIITDDD